MPSVDKSRTYMQLKPTAAADEQSDESEMLSRPTESPPLPRKRSHLVMLAGVVLVFAAIGAVTFAKAWTPAAPIPQSKSVEELFGAEVSDATADFLNSRRLAQTITLNFDVKCATDQPICNPEVAFASDMQKVLDSMKRIAPELYHILEKSKLNRAQQEFIMKVLPLAKNMKILHLGEIVAKTVERWEKSGSKVVHQKVKEAMDQYLQSHGRKTRRPRQSNTGNSTMLLSHLGPGLISMVKQNDEAVPRKLLDIGERGLVILVVGSSLLGVGVIVSIILLVLEVLNYTGILLWTGIYKKTTMWIKGLLGSIECLGVVTCPFVFLSYWLDAWLLYGRNPSEMEGIPYDFMLKHLPGLKHGHPLLISDP